MFSDIIEINLADPYFTNNNINYMNGTYIIGVYGKKNTTFIL